MVRPKFDPAELKVTQTKELYPGGPKAPFYSFPVTMKEGYKAALGREPLWQCCGYEYDMFCPGCYPDNKARAFVLDGTEWDWGNNGDGLDMFGVQWENVPGHGCMVRPGNPKLEDMNEWEDKIEWPDPDEWDWAGNAERSHEWLAAKTSAVSAWIMNGWFERLLSFMNTSDALIALVDEDQKDAVKAFFQKQTDLYCKIVDKHLEYFPEIDVFYIHDDWGTQRAPFFSVETGRELIVPYMRQLTDHIHSKGRFAELHSCGKLDRQVENVVAAGFDTWQGQLMNDTQAMYEEFGDQIVMQVTPDLWEPEDLTIDEQRQAARDYAAKFCNPDKPSIFNGYGNQVMTDAFREELYKCSRINYCGAL